MTVDPRSLDTDELVATLRNVADYLPTSTYEWPEDASELRAAAELIERVVVPLHDVWLQAKPPCLTCGGKGLATPLDRTRTRPKRCAACGRRGWRLDLDERCEHCNPCCEEHFPSDAQTPEEQAEHVCPNCGWEANPDWLNPCPDCSDGVLPFDKWVLGLVK